MSPVINEISPEQLEEMVAEHHRLNPDRPIRADIKEALDSWAACGLLPGDFLTAVLQNDLMEALGRADSYNRATIFQICSYIYNELPSTCHGSPEKVEAYARSFRDPQESA